MAVCLYCVLYSYLLLNLKVITSYNFNLILDRKPFDLFDYYFLGPYDLTADLECVSEWDNEKYIELINKFDKEIPIEKRGVHIVSNIKNEFNNKFKNYGFIALGMDSTIIKSGIKNLEKLWI